MGWFIVKFVFGIGGAILGYEVVRSAYSGIAEGRHLLNDPPGQMTPARVKLFSAAMSLPVTPENLAAFARISDYFDTHGLRPQAEQIQARVTKSGNDKTFDASGNLIAIVSPPDPTKQPPHGGRIDTFDVADTVLVSRSA